MSSVRRLVALGAALLAIIIVVGPAAPAFASTAILGGGSGFAALEIDQWRADTARSPYNLSINYVAQGSTFGRSQFTQGTFDYAASDIQYMQSEVPDVQGRKCGGKPLASCFVYVPVSAGGLAFMYNLNLPGGPLKLTRHAACKIFTGAITKWNDPEIVKYNPSLAARGDTITPVIRADGAGESYVLSEFCIAVAPDVWGAFVAQQKAAGLAGSVSPEFNAGLPTSLWPQGGWGANPVPQATADGTASYVADPTGGPNSITYVAAGYAKVRNFPTASVQNGAGDFTQPDEANVTVALGYAHPRGNGTFQLAFNGPDPRAYFPSTYSYVLGQTAGFDPGKGATLGRYLCYAVTKGQEIAPPLRYARLSSALVNIAIDAIVQIPGAPSKASCPIAGAAPPPPPPSVVPPGSNPGSGPTTPGNNPNARGNSGNPNGAQGNNNTNNPTGGTSATCTTTTTTTPKTTTTLKSTKATAKAATTTTTTTRPAATCTVATLQQIAKANARARAGAALTASDLAKTQTEAADSALAQAVAHTHPGSGGVSTIWIVVAGLACAMGITWARRKAAA